MLKGKVQSSTLRAGLAIMYPPSRPVRSAMARSANEAGPFPANRSMDLEGKRKSEEVLTGRYPDQSAIRANALRTVRTPGQILRGFGLGSTWE